MLDDVVEARADEPAHERGQRHPVGVVVRAAELLHAPGDHRAGHEERRGEAQPERLEGDAEDVDLGLHGARGYGVLQVVHRVRDGAVDARLEVEVRAGRVARSSPPSR